MWRNPQKTADLVAFAEEIFNGKLFIFRAVFIVAYNIAPSSALVQLIRFIDWIDCGCLNKEKDLNVSKKILQP